MPEKFQNGNSQLQPKEDLGSLCQDNIAVQLSDGVLTVHLFLMSANCMAMTTWAVLDAQISGVTGGLECPPRD